MDFDAIRAFVEVAETRSFSLAAEKLFITQPAVSKRIAALEDELDHTLFDRLGKHVELTEAGEQLLPRALSILQNIHQTKRHIQELSGEITGTLRVATSHHIGLHHLPPMLREFASTHQNVNLQFEFLDSEKAYSKVLEGECEMAIVTIAPTTESPLQTEILWQDPLYFVCGINHQLAQKGITNLSTLSAYPAILPDLNTFTGRLVKAGFEEQKLSLKLNMATNYLETIKMMVGVGLGWSVLPKTLIDEHMHILPIDDISLIRHLGIITHKKRTFSNAGQAFYQTIKNTASAQKRAI